LQEVAAQIGHGVASCVLVKYRGRRIHFLAAFDELALLDVEQHIDAGCCKGNAIEREPGWVGQQVDPLRVWMSSVFEEMNIRTGSPRATSTGSSL
jgi:hypothetical protein